MNHLLLLLTACLFSVQSDPPSAGTDTRTTLIVFHDSCCDMDWLEAIQTLSQNFRIIPVDTNDENSNRRELAIRPNNHPILLSCSKASAQDAQIFLNSTDIAIQQIQLPADSEDLRILSDMFNYYVNLESQHV